MVGESGDDANGGCGDEETVMIHGDNGGDDRGGGGGRERGRRRERERERWWERGERVSEGGKRERARKRGRGPVLEERKWS